MYWMSESVNTLKEGGLTLDALKKLLNQGQNFMEEGSGEWA